MSELAAFVEVEKEAILDLFVQRSQRERAARHLSRKRLVDHLPLFLGELAAALRAPTLPAGLVFARSPSSEKHGEQRQKDGYDVEALVREYGVLLDSILELMEGAGLTPTYRDLRVLTGTVSAASHEAVSEYLQEQRSATAGEHARLLRIFENAPSFVAILQGPEHRFEMTNAAYQRLIGERSVLGKTVAEALPEVVQQGYIDMLDSVYRNGKAVEGRNSRVALRRASDRVLEEAFVDFIYAPIFGPDGAVTGVLVEGHDVTQSRVDQLRREEAEDALRSSEERFRTLLENVDEGFCVIEMLPDETGRFTDWLYVQANRAFAKQSGLDDAVGRRIREFVPEHDQFWFDLYSEVLRTGEPARAEFYAEAMGRWFDVFAVRLGGPSSRELVVLFRDTSERKRVEVERERLLALEVEARQRSEEVSRMKDDFLATLSHELRTPLHAMLGWVTMLQKGKLSDDKRDRALATIARNAHAQSQLIEDLLDMSRIMAGKLRLELGPVDVREVAEAQLDSTKPSADAKSIQISARLESEAVIEGDTQRLQQVIGNLLSNAVKFTPVGGQIRVSLDCDDSGAAELRVSDTGRGIAADFLPHVFDRFRQESSGSARGAVGLGLGLSITRQLVELHGGTIRATSDGEGRGASFTVRLPLASLRESVLPRSLAAAEDHQLAGVRMLLVDDEADSRELLRETLELERMHVRAASSAAECSALLREQLPDVLISDLGMPGEDGFTLLRSLRTDATLQRVPAIALTAFAREEDRTRALEAGFDAFLTKPVEVRALLTSIVTVLQRTRGAWKKK